MATSSRSRAKAWWRPNPLHREMAYVGGTLYTSGAALLGLSLVVPAWEGRREGVVLAVAVVAAVVGVLFLLAADRFPLPLWLFATATGFGAVLVTVVVVAGGGEAASASYGVLYVFVAAYAYYYYPTRIALIEIALVAVGFGIALALLDVEGAVAEWIMVVGAAVIAGGLIGTLGRRVRKNLDLERATVATLGEVDRWKTTYLRAAAHDLRSPLATMIGMTTTVRAQHDQLSAEDRDELLDRAIASGHRLQALLTDLLDVERIGAGELEPRLEPTALDQLVRRVVSQVDLRDHPCEVVAEPVTVAVEASKIERIVENLVNNAIRHTQRDAPIWVRVEEAQDEVVLTVEDGGPGVDDEAKAVLFEAFQTGQPGGPGPMASHGLGLHLVLRFAQLHGGRVALEDRPGGGACFRVHLPKHHEAVPAGS